MSIWHVVGNTNTQRSHRPSIRTRLEIAVQGLRLLLFPVVPVSVHHPVHLWECTRDGHNNTITTQSKGMRTSNERQ